MKDSSLPFSPTLLPAPQRNAVKMAHVHVYCLIKGQMSHWYYAEQKSFQAYFFRMADCCQMY